MKERAMKIDAMSQHRHYLNSLDFITGYTNTDNFTYDPVGTYFAIHATIGKSSVQLVFSNGSKNLKTKNVKSISELKEVVEAWKIEVDKTTSKDCVLDYMDLSILKDTKFHYFKPVNERIEDKEHAKDMKDIDEFFEDFSDVTKHPFIIITILRALEYYLQRVPEKGYENKNMLHRLEIEYRYIKKAVSKIHTEGKLAKDISILHTVVVDRLSGKLDFNY